MERQYSFEYHGGVYRNSLRECHEKFLLFLIQNGQEIPFFKAVNLNFVYRSKEDLADSIRDSRRFISPCPYLKLFLQHRTPNTPYISFSFYLRVVDKEKHPTVTIKPFRVAFPDRYANNSIAHTLTNAYLKGKFSFLKKEEALDLLHASQLSQTYLRHQKMLPVETLKKLVTVEKWLPPGLNMRYLRF